MGQVNVTGTLEDAQVVQVAGGSLRNMKDGSLVAGLAAVPWAKFIVDSSDPTVGVDPTIACNYMIEDREVYPGGGCPIFQINPLVAKKRSIISKHLYVSAFANRPSAVDFPGLPIMIGDFGNAIAVSDGANYFADGRQYIYNEENGTLTTPTKTYTTGLVAAFVFTSNIPNIPANLIVPGKSIIRINYSVRRRGAVGSIDFAVKLGTGGNSGDPIASFGTLSAVDNYYLRSTSKITFPDSTHFLTNRSNNEAGVGTNLLFEGGASQLDTTQPLIPKFMTTTVKDTSVYVDLLDVELIWER